MLVGTTMMEKLIFSLSVAGIAIIIVFAILFALMLIIKIRSYIIKTSVENRSGSKNYENNRDDVLTEVAQGAQVIDLNSDCELVAVIMAALSAHTGKSANELNIKTIKRVNNSNWKNTSI